MTATIASFFIFVCVENDDPTSNPRIIHMVKKKKKSLPNILTLFVACNKASLYTLLRISHQRDGKTTSTPA